MPGQPAIRLSDSDFSSRPESRRVGGAVADRRPGAFSPPRGVAGGRIAAALASGRLLLETIICLVVLGMFSMFIFQKQLAQQKQLEEVNAAGAIRTLRDAVKSAVAVQRDDLVGYPEGVTLKDASEFLPQEYFSGFRVAVRREGAKLSAIIVSPTSLGRYALDNLSAARISSMLGASGGFVPSLTDEPSSTASGTLGLWSLDINEISAEFADPVRIVVNIEFSEELGGLPAEEKEKILYRTADYGQASNTMLTSLFFSDGIKDDVIVLDPTDGSISADGAITAGSLSVGGGSFLVDSAGNLAAAGAIAAGTLSIAGGKFLVGPNGAITAKGADFGAGPLVAGKATFSGLVEASDFQMDGGLKMSDMSGFILSAAYNDLADGAAIPPPACPAGYGPAAVVAPAAGAGGGGAAILSAAAVPQGPSGWRLHLCGYSTANVNVYCKKASAALAASGSAPSCEWLFTADGTFTVPKTANYQITVIGGGGGGGHCHGNLPAGGGGGSTAFYSNMLSPVIASGGGGGTHCGSGASGAVVTRNVSLIKNTPYIVKIGQGGMRQVGGGGYTPGGNGGGNTAGVLVGACTGCGEITNCKSTFRSNGGDGGNWELTPTVRGGSWQSSIVGPFEGGCGGRLSGEKYQGDGVTVIPGGAGYELKNDGATLTLGVFGGGGSMAINSYANASSSGAVYIKER
ncbi:hypothetical protein FACS1894186_1120 [Alphaproteobacteria bacterium]|nr:hypothetical protein FACS1894186_1120 [Alphaproteobacteria bacterium]